MVRVGSNPIEECYDHAAERGYSVFAVQYKIECFTAVDAERTYRKYGAASNCKNGVGGDWALDVYKIVSCLTG